jgi:hypothetical protein
MNVAQQPNNNFLSQITEPIKNTMDTIRANIPEIQAPDTQQITGAFDNLKTNITTGISDSLNKFSSESEVGTSAPSDFLNSNSIIAKFVFLIFVLIAFMFLANLGIRLIGYFTEPSKDPYVIKGMVPGNANIIVHQDPSIKDSVPILRSNNKSKGLEFTWTAWIFIDDIKTGVTTPKYSHIFSKGNTNFNSDGIATVNNGPGVYLSNTKNEIRIYMDTVKDNNNFLTITEIPLRKWLHLAIRVQNNVLDVYINGVMSGRKLFSEVPKQNYENILVGYNGGFSGSLSNMVYYARAVNVFELNNTVMYGPNLKQSTRVADNSRSGYYSYLSNLWYYSKL